MGLKSLHNLFDSKILTLKANCVFSMGCLFEMYFNMIFMIILFGKKDPLLLF